jgi:Ion channel
MDVVQHATRGRLACHRARPVPAAMGTASHPRVASVATIGYVVMEGYGWIDALYMTVITLGTVGYAETSPLDTAGRLFTIGVDHHRLHNVRVRRVGTDQPFRDG